MFDRDTAEWLGAWAVSQERDLLGSHSPDGKYWVMAQLDLTRGRAPVGRTGVCSVRTSQLAAQISPHLFFFFLGGGG